MKYICLAHLIEHSDICSHSNLVLEMLVSDEYIK